MKTCPNPSCPEKQRGAAPTYRDDATVCPKCATPLSSSAAPSTSMALPSTASMTPTSTPSTWQRSAWATLLLVATGLALTRIPLPGVDLEALGVRVDAATLLRGGLAPLSVGALGLAPLLAAFFVVEVAAWAVPALRRWRSAPAGRARLTRAALALGLGLALLHAWMLLRWVTSSSWAASPCSTTARPRSSS